MVQVIAAVPVMVDEAVKVVSTRAVPVVSSTVVPASEVATIDPLEETVVGKTVTCVIVAVVSMGKLVTSSDLTTVSKVDIGRVIVTVTVLVVEADV
jgi:hypothetical protein